MLEIGDVLPLCYLFNIVSGFGFNFVPGQGCGGDLQIVTLSQDKTGEQDVPCGVILKTETSFKIVKDTFGTSSSSGSTTSTQINIPNGKLPNKIWLGRNLI